MPQCACQAAWSLLDFAEHMRKIAALAVEPVDLLTARGVEAGYSGRSVCSCLHCGWVLFIEDTIWLVCEGASLDNGEEKGTFR